jgi:hypothetical protein
MLAYLLVTNDAKSITSHRIFNVRKKFVANNLIAGSFIFTYYGIILLEIKNKWYLVLLFFGQFIPSFVN